MSSNRNWREFGPSIPYETPIDGPTDYWNSSPLFQLLLSEVWLPHVNGAIKQLLAEEIWEHDDDSTRQWWIENTDQILTAWTPYNPTIPPHCGLIPSALIGTSSSTWPIWVYDPESSMAYRFETGEVHPGAGGVGIGFYGYNVLADYYEQTQLLDIVIQILAPYDPDGYTLTVNYDYYEDGNITHNLSLTGNSFNLSDVAIPYGYHVNNLNFNANPYGVWWHIVSGYGLTEG